MMPNVTGAACKHVRQTSQEHTKFWPENLKGRDNLESLGLGGRIVLKCILNNQDMWCEIDSPGSGSASVAATMIMHLWVRYKKENILSNCATISFSGKSVFHGVRYEKL
jgi:hypothetical protein